MEKLHDDGPSYGPKPLVPISPVLPYFAGIVDARGSIGINLRNNHPQPRIRVMTGRLRLLEWLAGMTGVGVMTCRPCSDDCTKRHYHTVRQSTQWTVDSSRAPIVLYNIRPFLIAQADLARDAYLAGVDVYPPARGNVPEQMRKLGWRLPEVEKG